MIPHLDDLDPEVPLNAAYSTFTYAHVVCGATVQVTEGREQPHRCRIDLDAQMGR